VWTQPRRDKAEWVAQAYRDYSAGKQTLAELSICYGRSTRTIRRRFEDYTPAALCPDVPATPVALSFDATFFGRGYGFLVYRACGRNIHWQEIVGETLAVIEQGLRHLQVQGWQFSSVTIDGRRGVISLLERLFPGTPVQLCLFHQKAIIRRYTTSRPKTDCGKAICNLMADILFMDEKEFLKRLHGIKQEYRDFLKERNEQNQFKHRRLRSALRSLTTNAPYLFTSRNHPELAIPNTTNSCDGSFAHWKAKVKIHRGIRKDRRVKMTQALLAQS
jgi:hypothetical protein